MKYIKTDTETGLETEIKKSDLIEELRPWVKNTNQAIEDLQNNPIRTPFAIFNLTN